MNNLSNPTESTKQIELIGLEELASQLKNDHHIPRAWTRRMARAGIFPRLKIGNRSLYNLKPCLELLIKAVETPGLIVLPKSKNKINVENEIMEPCNS